WSRSPIRLITQRDILLAATFGKLNVLKLFYAISIQSTKLPKDITTWEVQSSILIKAAENRHFNIVEFVFESMQEKNCGLEELRIFDLLRSIGSHENSKESGKKPLKSDFLPALYYAAKSNSYEIFKYLVEKGACINFRDSAGWTPLMIAADFGGLQIAELLIEKKVDLNAITNEGWTALTIAVHGGYYKIAEILLKNGADVEIQTRNLINPLIKAVSLNNECMIQLLISYNANVNVFCYHVDGIELTSPLSFAAYMDQPKIVEILLQSGALFSQKAGQVTNDSLNICGKLRTFKILSQNSDTYELLTAYSHIDSNMKKKGCSSGERMILQYILANLFRKNIEVTKRMIGNQVCTSLNQTSLPVEILEEIIVHLNPILRFQLSTLIRSSWHQNKVISEHEALTPLFAGSRGKSSLLQRHWELGFHFSSVDIRYIMSIASYNGHINVLNWMKENVDKYWDFKFRDRASYVWGGGPMDLASETNQIQVLEWWKKEILLIDPSESRYLWCSHSMAFASGNGHIDVLEWWRNSGLRIRWESLAMDKASANGHVAVLEWWKNSDLELKWSESAMDLSSKNGHVDILEWWKMSGLELKWGIDAIDNAAKAGHIEVLKWWIESGLPLKWSNDILKRIRQRGHLYMHTWWLEKNEELLLKKFHFDSV
ncbi:hypothetical protein HK096_004148, partial [Nowakowskiella sp. JEL0078]